MARKFKLFGELLTTAIDRIRIRIKPRKPIIVIEDELGLALDPPRGRSFIEYLRKGYAPSEDSDTEQLTRELVRLGGLIDPAMCLRFLRAARYPLAGQLVAELFPEAEAPPEDPIDDPSAFFGQARLAHRFFSHYLRPQRMKHVIICGPRGSGKTSFLNHLYHLATWPTHQLRPDQQYDWLPIRTTYRWVRINFHDPRMKKLEYLMEYWLTAMAISIPTQLDLAYFVQALEEHHWQEPVVVVMDEIGAGFATGELDADFWAALCWVADNKVQDNLSLIFSAQKPLRELAQTYSKTSPLWTRFSTERLQPLADEDARALIASFDGQFSTADQAWILQQGSGQPKLLEILCQERLIVLKEGAQSDDAWQVEALARIEPLRYLLDGNQC